MRGAVVAFRAAPLSLKILGALSVALLPLGIVAIAGAWSSYSRLVAMHPHIRPFELLGVVTPALMWAVTLAIASILVNRLVVLPLRAMRGSVERYSGGDPASRIDERVASSPELLQLAQAFNTLADNVGAQAGQLKDALAAQKALTREVHHRVKNNLQIVSSLLSLQARDIGNPEVAEAYAVIRQRVNALSLVHRWMYQEEGAGGVDLRSLMADLSANLEHGFEGLNGRRRVVSAVDRMSVSQDIALPISFLVTELVAGARDVAGHPSDARVEARWEARGRAVLSVTSAEGFAGDNGFERFEDSARRIVTGLSRQLRAPLAFDPAAGAFTIAFQGLTRG